MRRDQVRFKATASDVDEMRAHYAKTLKPAQVDAIPGNRTISVEDHHFSIGDFDIWSGCCTSGMKVRFTEPPDVYALYVPLNGSMEFEFGNRTLSPAPDVLFACDLGKSTGLQFQPNRSHIGIAFSKRVVVQHLSNLMDAPVLHDLEFLGTIAMNQERGRKLAEMCHIIWKSLIENPEETVRMPSHEIFMQAIMATVLESVQHRYSGMMEGRRPAALPWHVKRAIEFMSARVTTPLSMDEIAREVGVSVRALQLAFQQFRDTTPTAYLRQLRLEGARRELIANTGHGVLISDVARRWGFLHVGRFSSIYAGAYGETPKETMRNAQRGSTKAGR